MTTGIYKLTNKTNGKIYIGSAVDVKFRWRCHRNNPTSLIGRALKKYGNGGFLWEVIEETSLEILLKREQHYMDTLQPFGGNGYNIARIAGNTLGIPCTDNTKKKISEANTGKFVGDKSAKAKSTIFLSPDGELIRFPSIGLGCREKGLNIACMAEVARGKRRQYKGWTCPNAPEWIPTPRCNHIVVSPDDIEYHVINIKEFCENHDLNVVCMRKVLTNNGQSQYRGWRLKDADVKIFCLLDPSGQAHRVFEMKAFAEENNLSYGAMRALVCGNQKYHKGWSLVGNG